MSHFEHSRLGLEVYTNLSKIDFPFIFLSNNSEHST